MAKKQKDIDRKGPGTRRVFASHTPVTYFPQLNPTFHSSITSQ
jgi:hypothetical protein